MECFFFKCNYKFIDYELMFKYLVGCRYFVLGEYWCYNYMRVEYFDDIRCKKCFGYLFWVKKVFIIVKKFFYGLGYKLKKG